MIIIENMTRYSTNPDDVTGRKRNASESSSLSPREFSPRNLSLRQLSVEVVGREPPKAENRDPNEFLLKNTESLKNRVKSLEMNDVFRRKIIEEQQTLVNQQQRIIEILVQNPFLKSLITYLMDLQI